MTQYIKLQRHKKIKEYIKIKSGFVATQNNKGVGMVNING